MNHNQSSNRNTERAQSSTVRSGAPVLAKSHSTWGSRPPELRHIGTSSDGYPVFDRQNSHHHLTDELLAAVIGRVSLAGEKFTEKCVDFGFVIGVTTCVATTPSDKIVYAQRENRAGQTRFVLNRRPEPCQTAVAIFNRLGGDKPGYLLITGFIGTPAAPEPWDRHATLASEEFWSKHALIWESCPLQKNA